MFERKTIEGIIVSHLVGEHPKEFGQKCSRILLKVHVIALNVNEKLFKSEENLLLNNQTSALQSK